MSGHIAIDETHSLAICTEIGERLRSVLDVNAPLPASLAVLVARLSELDFHESPSIVPAIDVLELDACTCQSAAIVLVPEFKTS